MEQLINREFEVYVHVPFCLRRCGYCDFNTYTSSDLGGGASRGNYAKKVIQEMRIVRRWQLDHHINEPQASSIFFGGGTPTVLSAHDLGDIVREIQALWGIQVGAEITTEANPDTVDNRYIDTLADAGFTRISFGMQSAVPHVLRTLDRTHTPSNVAAGVAAAQSAGLTSSVDLIYGAPGESLEDWRTSVQTAIDLGVNHISAYALSVEPHTKMGRQIAAGILPNPDDDDEANKYEIADALFSQAGLQWYEISNWSRPGYESQHNLGYWRNIDWAGIGPGAHSHYGHYVCEDNESSLRAWDILHPKLWGQRLDKNEVPWAGSEIITQQEQLEETVMLGLRLREGLDLHAVEHQAGTTFDWSDIDSLQAQGLIVRNGSRIVATLQGRLLNDLVIERVLNIIL